MKTKDQNKQDETKNGSAVRDCPDSAGSDSYGLKHPKIRAWKRKNRKAFEAHDKANDELVAICEESPRRPWYRKRHARAINKWGETLDAIPMPPSPNVEDSHAK
jgi:hypothetical protein